MQVHALLALDEESKHQREDEARHDRRQRADGVRAAARASPAQKITENGGAMKKKTFCTLTNSGTSGVQAEVPGDHRARRQDDDAGELAEADLLLRRSHSGLISFL